MTASVQLQTVAPTSQFAGEQPLTRRPAPAPKYNETREEQPLAIEDRRLTGVTGSATLGLAQLKCLSLIGRKEECHDVVFQAMRSTNSPAVLYRGGYRWDRCIP